MYYCNIHGSDRIFNVSSRINHQTLIKVLPTYFTYFCEKISWYSITKIQPVWYYYPQKHSWLSGKWSITAVSTYTVYIVCVSVIEFKFIVFLWRHRAVMTSAVGAILHQQDESWMGLWNAEGLIEWLINSLQARYMHVCLTISFSNCRYIYNLT